jgi:hypothetical protein
MFIQTLKLINMKKFILLLTCTMIVPLVTTAQNWLVTGNNNITSSQYLGTKDEKALDFRTNSTSRMTMSSSGNVGV